MFGNVEELKHLAHNIVVFQDKESLQKFNQALKCNFILSSKKTINQRRSDFAAQVNAGEDRFELQRLQQLEQLERLQRLQRLERFPTFGITNLDFQEVKIETPIEETIIYLDPPYRGTASYLEGALHSEIDHYFSNSPYSCFMSEYNAPFDSVLEIRKESLLNNTGVERKFVIEKLFWNKK